MIARVLCKLFGHQYGDIRSGDDGHAAVTYTRCTRCGVYHVTYRMCVQDENGFLRWQQYKACESINKPVYPEVQQ